MNTNRMLDGCNYNDCLTHTNTMSSDRIEHNYFHHNRDRNKHILLLLIVIFMCKCCAVTGDTIGKQIESFLFGIISFVSVCYLIEIDISGQIFKIVFRVNERNFVQTVRQVDKATYWFYCCYCYLFTFKACLSTNTQTGD